MARANFALNFFGCAGFAIVQSETLAESAADLVVLCSSDPEYLSLRQGRLPAHERAGRSWRGIRRISMTQLIAAGVAGFVHVQSNAVADVDGMAGPPRDRRKEAHAS